MASRAPSYPQIARAQWLLGLDAPESADEIRRAWKERVARTHPDRHAERAGAATRVDGGVQPGTRAVRVVARGGRAVAQADAARGAARGRARARRAAARAHAGAEPLVLPRRRSCGAGRARAAIAAGGRCSTVQRRRRPGRTAASSSRTARPPLPAISSRSLTAALSAGTAAARPWSAPRCAPARPAWRSWYSWSARSAPWSRRCAGIRSRARAGRATAAELGDHGPRGTRARALPLGRGRRPPSARGAPRAHARRLRARLRAVGCGLDRARRRRRQHALSRRVSCRSRPAAPRRARGSR